MKNQLNQNHLRKLSFTLCLALGTILLGSSDSYGLGFLIPNQDATAIGRGNAFAATADNPSAIYYNPAGITQIPGEEIEVGDLNYFGINTEYKSAAGGEANTKFKIVPVPHIYFAMTPTNLAVPLSFGIGVYAPFGLGVEWPANNPSTRSLAIDSQLYFVCVNPVIAYKPIDSLSIAIGPTINYAKIKFNRGLTTGSDYFQFEGDNFAYGLTAGLLYQPIKQLSFGLDYRLAVDENFRGTSTYNNGGGFVANVSSSGDVPFPNIVSGGVSYRPTDKWNMEADVDFINWNSIGAVSINGTKALFGQNLVLPLNWHNSWQYKFGITRDFDNGWYASIGYFYSSDTTASADYNPAIPDTDLHVGSIGIGHNGVHWHWAVAAQLIAGPARTINKTPENTDPFTGVSAAGSYALFVPAGTVSVGYSF